MRRPILLFCAGLVVATAATAVYFATAWKRPGLLTLADGTQVPDLLAHEAGPYSSPRFESVRKSYLENLRWYRQLEMMPVSRANGKLNDRDRFRKTVTELLASEPRSSACLERAGDAICDDLVNALELVLLRLAGMPRDTYEALMREERAWVGSPHLPENWALMPGRSPNDNPSRCFAELYDAWRVEEAKVVGIASEAPGWRVLVRERRQSELDGESPLSASLSEDDVKRFGGALSMKALVFHRWTPADSADNLESLARSVLQAELTFIVRAANDDLYPVAVVLNFDAQAGKWRLFRLFQRVSVRVPQAGALAL